MNNAQINARFLAIIDSYGRAEVLGNIARRYGITPEEAFEEVTGEGADSLPDYLRGLEQRAWIDIMEIYELREKASWVRYP